MQFIPNQEEQLKEFDLESLHSVPSVASIASLATVSKRLGERRRQFTLRNQRMARASSKLRRLLAKPVDAEICDKDFWDFLTECLKLVHLEPELWRTETQLLKTIDDYYKYEAYGDWNAPTPLAKELVAWFIGYFSKLKMPTLVTTKEFNMEASGSKSSKLK